MTEIGSVIEGSRFGKREAQQAGRGLGLRGSLRVMAVDPERNFEYSATLVPSLSLWLIVASVLRELRTNLEVGFACSIGHGKCKIESACARLIITGKSFGKTPHR